MVMVVVVAARMGMVVVVVAGLPPEILDLPFFEQKCYAILGKLFNFTPFLAVFDPN